MKIDGYEGCVSAAGRVNLIGEHIDYCGGKTLPAALSFRNKVYYRRNGTNVVNLAWTDLPDRVSLDLGRLQDYKTQKYAKYQAGCVDVWRRGGHKIVGCDLLSDCTVPFGSGLSSSAAIEVSTIAALALAAEEPFRKEEIALAAQRAENGYVGVNCGIMDQFVSACGRRGHALLLDCNTLAYEYIPINLGSCMLIIADCGKPHSLTESRYNDRRRETEYALSLLQTKADISCLADLTPARYTTLSGVLPEETGKRVRHVVEECERVRFAAEAMRSGDMARFGALLNASHASLRDLYEVTGFELDSLAAAAEEHPACLGSRMTGGGFGGCTVSLVRKDGAEAFRNEVRKRYQNETGYSVTFYDAEISDGLVINGDN